MRIPFRSARERWTFSPRRTNAPARRRGRNPFVFPGGRPRQPFSAMAFPATLRQMGVKDVTAHGFRTSFRTWASEVAHAEFEVAEACLSPQGRQRSVARLQPNDALGTPTASDGACGVATSAAESESNVVPIKHPKRAARREL